MNSYNIFWFIIDSVRTFRSGIDDRDRIDIMDELAKDSVEFTNCVTSAPSSLLSAGGIFTGLPGAFIARHFNDWKFKDANFSTIKELVDKYGYRSFPILDTRELRERLQFILPPLKKKDLPKGYQLSDYAWHNDQITDIFKHILNKNFNTAGCYTLWYDCRRDPNTSKHVKDAIDEIKKLGLYNNSIIIMHSDHGYPDPRTQLNEAYFKDLGHDMVLTDDNIKVPFLIKFPGIGQSRKMSNQIGLIDVMPTIFDILSIPYNPSGSKYHGSSLLPIISGDESISSRIRRTDTRLPMDSNRMASLRSDRYKYIYFFSDGSEVLFDLNKDPSELNNIIEISDNDILHKFRELLNDYENQLYLFHRKVLEANINNFVNSNISSSTEISSLSVAIVSNAEPSLIEILLKLLNINGLRKITLVTANQRNMKLDSSATVILIEKLNKNHTQYIGKDNLFDLCIYLTENSKRVFLKSEQRQAVLSLPASKVYMMNFNFEIFNYFHSKFLNTAFIKLFFDWEIKGYFYKQEPMYFLRDLMFFILGLFRRITMVFGEKERDFDLNASKEAFEFRKFHIESQDETAGLNKMDDEQLITEVERIHTRE